MCDRLRSAHGWASVFAHGADGVPPAWLPTRCRTSQASPAGEHPISLSSNAGCMARKAASISAPCAVVRDPMTCLICAKPLTARQRICCSRRCASRRNVVVTHTRYPQRGANNFNFKGWRSRTPILYTRPFKTSHPDYVRAHRIVARAIRAGRLIRPDFCESCLQKRQPDAHHDDHMKPLDIQWLCRTCHIARDKQLRDKQLRARRSVLHVA